MKKKTIFCPHLISSGQRIWGAINRHKTTLLLFYRIPAPRNDSNPQEVVMLWWFSTSDGLITFTVKKYSSCKSQLVRFCKPQRPVWSIVRSFVGTNCKNLHRGGSGWAAVGRVVTTVTIYPRFDSCHLQFYLLSTVSLLNGLFLASFSVYFRLFDS